MRQELSPRGAEDAIEACSNLSQWAWVRTEANRFTRRPRSHAGQQHKADSMLIVIEQSRDIAILCGDRSATFFFYIGATNTKTFLLEQACQAERRMVGICRART